MLTLRNVSYDHDTNPMANRCTPLGDIDGPIKIGLLLLEVT